MKNKWGWYWVGKVFVKYLGVTFASNGSPSAHINSVATSAEKSASAILRFFRKEGAHFIPTSL